MYFIFFAIPNLPPTVVVLAIGVVSIVLVAVVVVVLVTVVVGVVVLMPKFSLQI